MTQNLKPGLYIIATPIGNLGDISWRAARILEQVDVIAAEDTRVTAKLLRHLGLKKPMLAYHDHNAELVRPALLTRIAQGAVALVSDAGTPLISDPGYKLVRDTRAAGHQVITIPGPCAAVAALSVAGLPTDRFLFAGFLPNRAGARATAIAELAAVEATLVFYESAPRLVAMLDALRAELGDREAVVARELTKIHEEVVPGRLSDLIAHFTTRPPKGEIVVIVAPDDETPVLSDSEIDTALREALHSLSPAQAAAQVARNTGVNRKSLYARALALKA
ncbi:MAG: 16S rRNA (cytidine(1402)-2'-O)-methyltransferase [Alphaproteobacteria bacterium]|nr:16S rRNA (cytidine(1402)-2'-O)-methyltransferase [Alphaproteobacteria bacterium]